MDDRLADIAHNCGLAVPEGDREMLQATENILKQDEPDELDRDFLRFVKVHIEQSMLQHCQEEKSYLSNLAVRIGHKLDAWNK